MLVATASLKTTMSETSRYTRSYLATLYDHSVPEDTEMCVPPPFPLQQHSPCSAWLNHSL